MSNKNKNTPLMEAVRQLGIDRITNIKTYYVGNKEKIDRLTSEYNNRCEEMVVKLTEQYFDSVPIDAIQQMVTEVVTEIANKIDYGWIVTSYNTLIDTIRESIKSTHGDSFELPYFEKEYVRLNNRPRKITITCPIHGNLLINLYSLINNNTGCSKCSTLRAHISRDNNREYGLSEMIKFYEYIKSLPEKPVNGIAKDNHKFLVGLYNDYLKASQLKAEESVNEEQHVGEEGFSVVERTVTLEPKPYVDMTPVSPEIVNEVLADESVVIPEVVVEPEAKVVEEVAEVAPIVEEVAPAADETDNGRYDHYKDSVKTIEPDNKSSKSADIDLKLLFTKPNPKKYHSDNPVIESYRSVVNAFMASIDDIDPNTIVDFKLDNQGVSNSITMTMSDGTVISMSVTKITKPVLKTNQRIIASSDSTILVKTLVDCFNKYLEDSVINGRFTKKAVDTNVDNFIKCLPIIYQQITATNINDVSINTIEQMVIDAVHSVINNTPPFYRMNPSMNQSQFSQSHPKDGRGYPRW